MDKAELIEALAQIEKEKGIDKETIFQALETSLVAACKKNYGPDAEVKVVFDKVRGGISVYLQKLVCDEVYDDALEITLEDAQKINPNYQMGDTADVVVDPHKFGRISAKKAKGLVVQKMREAERDMSYHEFRTKEKDIVTGIVQRRDKKSIIVQLGKTDAFLAASEQIANDDYYFNQRLKFYVVDVKQTTKGPQVNLSRTHPNLVKRLFELEVPEVYDGTVEIKSIAREPGSRTKIAVYSKNPDVDAVGACVGINGSRVDAVVAELGNEKMDIINWSADPRRYVAAALAPSVVLAAAIDEDERGARIVVPDHQLSLAIGREGQNAKLAARLTGWRIDIKSETQARLSGFVNDEDYLSDEFYDEYDDEDFYDESADYGESDESGYSENGCSQEGEVSADYEKQYGEFYGTDNLDESNEPSKPDNPELIVLEEGGGL